jgi:hypothetical protein
MGYRILRPRHIWAARDIPQNHRHRHCARSVSSRVANASPRLMQLSGSPRVEVAKKGLTMSSDVLTISMVIIFGGALAGLGVLVTQLLDRKSEMKPVKVAAPRFRQFRQF